MHPLHSHRHMALAAVAAAAIGLLVACSTESEPPTAAVQQADAHAAHARANNGDLSPAQKQAITRVRNTTTRFHELAAAQAAGYTEQYPAGCAVSPDGEGAQAFHYLNPGLVDANVELLRPELLMYEPGPNGQMQLIGVDYIVPLELSATPPTLLGVPFMRNEPLGVWALHIWAWRPNPSGMFAAWNPKVSCEHAP